MRCYGIGNMNEYHTYHLCMSTKLININKFNVEANIINQSATYAI